MGSRAPSIQDCKAPKAEDRYNLFFKACGECPPMEGLHLRAKLGEFYHHVLRVAQPLPLRASPKN